MTGAKRYEYRLRWQRLGRGAVSRIMQTERGAVEKAERMLDLDEMKGGDGLETFGDMPDLESLSLERREVGDWTAHRTFDVPEPDPDSVDQPDDRFEPDTSCPW